jgi:hypothetical protein
MRYDDLVIKVKEDICQNKGVIRKLFFDLNDKNILSQIDIYNSLIGELFFDPNNIKILSQIFEVLYLNIDDFKYNLIQNNIEINSIEEYNAQEVKEILFSCCIAFIDCAKLPSDIRMSRLLKIGFYHPGADISKMLLEREYFRKHGMGLKYSDKEMHLRRLYGFTDMGEVKGDE